MNELLFKDMEKMEKEMIETSEKLSESEKLNTKLQKDLERVVELQQKVRESGRTTTES